MLCVNSITKKFFYFLKLEKIFEVDYISWWFSQSGYI